MSLRETNTAFFNTEQVFALTPEIMTEVKLRASESTRNSYRICLHHNHEDSVQEMVIAMHRDTYWIPHRHPADICESYAVLEGHVRVFIFDNSGEVLRTIDLKPYGHGEAFIYRLSTSTWHMPVSISEWSVYHEVSPGPFLPEGFSEFAPWAPTGKDPQACQDYIKRLRNGDF